MIEAPFLKLGRITEVTEDRLSAESVALDGEPQDLLEAMAQCAAYHVRSVTEFSRQAFLMKVTRFPLAGSGIREPATLTAQLTGSSQGAWSYTVTAVSEGRSVTASLLIGATPFGDRFEAERLVPYHQEIFSCLMRA